MNVLSLFDGISCGQIALQRAGIKVDNYFASEIDKYAIKITQKNYPNTIQLGDVNNWKEWKLPKIDLLFGGSPCQGFSNAGAGLNFADPRSKLFFVFLEILKHYKPKYWMLENVKMKKEWQNIITSYLGIEPILINSALVSAQNRQRLYWTNIPNITQPEDKHIYLKDVIEHGEVDRQKSYCIDANYFKGGSVKMYKEKARRQIVNLPTNSHQSERRLMVQEPEEPVLLHNIYGGFKETKPRTFTGKSPTIRTSAGGGHIPSVVIGRMVGRKLDENGKRKDYSNIPAVQQLEPRTDDKSGCLTTVQKDNVVINSTTKRNQLIVVGNVYPSKGQNGNIYSIEGKSKTLSAGTGVEGRGIGSSNAPKITEDYITFRMLTPLECERLQTIPEGYTEGISNTQRYKALGNGWTVDVIVHIFSFIPKENL